MPDTASTVGQAVRLAPSSAADQLERILYLLPIAAREGGAHLEGMETEDPRPGVAGIRATITQGLQESTDLRILHFKPDEHGGPERRTDRPYALILAEGHWYLPAFCEEARDLRNFPMERILEAVPTGVPFPVPGEFDAHACIHGGRVFRGG